MSTLITPTPGRIVWYFPSQNDGVPASAGQPLAAVVAAVHNDRLVNLAVFDHYGNTHSRPNVQLVQEDDVYITAGSRAEWMPYQRAAAAAASQAEQPSLLTATATELQAEAPAEPVEPVEPTQSAEPADEVGAAAEGGAEAAATQEQKQ